MSIDGIWRTYASCKIPDAASKSGESPIFEMILAEALCDELFTANAPPMMRRVQKTNSKSHPMRPGRACLTRR